VVLFSNDFDHPQFYAEVYRIITELEPQRELHVVLKWEAEIEPAYQELIEEEGSHSFHKRCQLFLTSGMHDDVLLGQ